MYNIKAMTTSEVAASLGTSNKVILENAKKCLPDKEIKNGVATLWTEAEFDVLKKQLQMNAHNNIGFNLSLKLGKGSGLQVNNKGKDMKTKEIADMLNTTENVILANARKCLPYKKIENGIATLWSEAEATVLLDHLKNNPNTSANELYVESKSTVSTKLTPALKIKKAFDLMREGYEEELAILKAQNAEQQKQLSEAQPKVSYYDNLIDTGGLTNLRNTAKLLKIPERKFIKRLEIDGYLFRNKRGELQPYSEYNNLLFEIKEWQHGEKSGVQTFVTVFGKKVFLNKYQKEKAQ